MAMYDDPADTRRRKNIVPRSRSFFPAASQFIGGVSHPAVEAMNRPQSEWGTPSAGMPRLRREQLDTYQIPNPEGGFSTIRVKAGSRPPAGYEQYRTDTGTLDATPSHGATSYSGAFQGPVMQGIEASLPTLSSNAMNQVQYGVPPMLSEIPSSIARPAKTPRVSTPSAPGYHFGQNVRRGAWKAYAGAANAGIWGQNLLYRPVANVFSGIFGGQPTQPMRYFDF